MTFRGPLLLLLVIVIGIAAFAVTDLRPSHIQQVIRSFGMLAPVFYLAIYVLSCVFLIPASIITLAGGLAFGPLWGTLLAVTGAVLGASAAFYVARRLGRETVARFLTRFGGGRLAAFDETAGRHGFKVILLMRVIPVFPFIGVNYGAGLSQIEFRDFFLATLIGIGPGTFAFVYLGSTLTNIYSRQFVYAVLILAIVAGTPILYRKWQGKRIFSFKP